MTMKTRDYLAICVTSHLMASLETITRKISRKDRIKHMKRGSYTQNRNIMASTAASGAEHDGVPSPNCRCGFVTGKESFRNNYSWKE